MSDNFLALPSLLCPQYLHYIDEENKVPEGLCVIAQCYIANTQPSQDPSLTDVRAET